MTSSYKGLYVQRLNNGKIYSVQVVDPGGNSISLEPDIYIQREVQPPIDELPDKDEYNKNS